MRSAKRSPLRPINSSCATTAGPREVARRQADRQRARRLDRRARLRLGQCLAATWPASRNPRNTFACLILGPTRRSPRSRQSRRDFQGAAAARSHARGGQRRTTPSAAAATDDAIRGNLQARAGAIAQATVSSATPSGRSSTLLKYAISEDGALHAEKYYRTVSEEFASRVPPSAGANSSPSPA